MMQFDACGSLVTTLTDCAEHWKNSCWALDCGADVNWCCNEWQRCGEWRLKNLFILDMEPKARSDLVWSVIHRFLISKKVFRNGQWKIFHGMSATGIHSTWTSWKTGNWQWPVAPVKWVVLLFNVGHVYQPLQQIGQASLLLWGRGLWIRTELTVKGLLLPFPSVPGNKQAISLSLFTSNILR